MLFVMRWIGAIAIVLSLGAAATTSADQEGVLVHVQGRGAALEVKRDAWVELCRAPCVVHLSDEDADGPLRVRSTAGVRDVELGENDTDVTIDVGDQRSLRTGLAITSGAFLASAVVLFGVSL